MSDDSSCRPDRLLAFDATTQAMADGLQRRAAALADAIGPYLAGCDAAYTVPCGGVVTPIAQWRGDLRAFGSWTSAVGRAFAMADANFEFTHGPAKRVVGIDEAKVASSLRRFHGRFESTATASTHPPTGPDRRSNSDREPAERRLSSDAGAAASVGAETARAVDVGERATAEMDRAAKEVESRLDLAADAGAGGAGALRQWASDVDLDAGQRAERAAWRAVADGLGSALGTIALESIAEAACGPIAPVCAVVAAPEASAISGAITDDIIDKLPWMRPVHFNPSHPNLHLVRRHVAEDGQEVGPDAEESVGLAAGTVAEDVLDVSDPLAAENLDDVEDRSGTEQGYLT